MEGIGAISLLFVVEVDAGVKARGDAAEAGFESLVNADIVSVTIYRKPGYLRSWSCTGLSVSKCFP